MHLYKKKNKNPKIGFYKKNHFTQKTETPVPGLTMGYFFLKKHRFSRFECFGWTIQRVSRFGDVHLIVIHLLANESENKIQKSIFLFEYFDFLSQLIFSYLQAILCPLSSPCPRLPHLFSAEYVRSKQSTISVDRTLLFIYYLFTSSNTQTNWILENRFKYLHSATLVRRSEKLLFYLTWKYLSVSLAST